MKLREVNYCFFIILPVALALVELEDFFPYGKSNGDEILKPTGYGHADTRKLPLPFPFFDIDYDSFYINGYGAIFLLSNAGVFFSDGISLPTGEMTGYIAPFWADSKYWAKNCTIYNRQTQDNGTLARVSNEIRKYFVEQRHFSAKWAMVVTWEDMPPYVFTFAENYLKLSNKKNTFQVVIATDGIKSFSIFNYNKLQWIDLTYLEDSPHGKKLYDGRKVIQLSNLFSVFYYDEIQWTTKIPTPLFSDGKFGQAGFIAGTDGAQYYNLPGSFTQDLLNVSSKSNVGVPGKWIFQVDGEAIKRPGCNFVDEDLVLSPRSGLELGGTKMFISGPCFNPRNNIICRFNQKIQTDGVYISKFKAFCVTPPLYVTGRIPVEVSVDNGKTFNFKGSFRSIPLGRNAPDVEGLRVREWAKSSSTWLTWDPVSINTSRVDIEILLFDSVNNTLLEKSFKSHKNIPNTGNNSLNLAADEVFPSILLGGNTVPNSDDEARTPVAIVRITPSLSTVEKLLLRKPNTVKLYSIAFLLTPLVKDLGLSCDAWYFKDRREFLEIESLPCPTSLVAMSAERIRFKQDKSVKNSLSQIFHPSSKQCFQSTQPSSSGSEQQCCYDDDGRLIVGLLQGGTPNVVSPDLSYVRHLYHDVLSWLLCCGLSNECEKYYENRPSDDGSRYVAPSIAVTDGDPHLVTFDGTSYTFNGHGEYVLLNISEFINFTLQGRMEPIIDSQGKKTKATALTALVVKETGSDTAQIELNSRRLMDVFINGARVNFDEQTRLDFTGVFLIRQDRSKLSVIFNSGVYIDVTATEEMLAYEIIIPVVYKGKTAGLLGYWDDNKEKEFLLPNGKFLDTNSRPRVLHYQFGQKWLVDKNSTLFTYRLGKDYDDYVDLNFTPIFIDTILQFSTTSLEEEAKKICGDSKECLFDIAVSGKAKIGQTTFKSISDRKERKKKSIITADPVIFGCDGVQNSGKNVDKCGVCGGDDSTCTDCEGIVRPGVKVNNRNCDFGPRKCAEWLGKGSRTDGVYKINPDGLGAFEVKCDMTTDGGGWTVFQRRVDGSENFYRDWADYKYGFGNFNGEFWLGLEKIHRMTKQEKNILRVDLENFENEKRYAKYGTFAVSNERKQYRLSVGKFSRDSSAGDSLLYHNGMKFSTRDKENDKDYERHCARVFSAAWWYNACHYSNLNGLFHGGGPHTSFRGDGISWYSWAGFYYSLKSEMKFRPG